jgi:hypothetical protein
MCFPAKSKRVGRVISTLLSRNLNFKDVEIFEKDYDGVFQLIEDWDKIQQPYYCMAKYKKYSHTWMFLPDLYIVYSSTWMFLPDVEDSEPYTVTYSKNTITIGCTEKTPEEWDDISVKELLKIDGRRAVEAYQKYFEEVFLKWSSGFRTGYRC